jgi:DNA-binding GntR family transcriptional regulator
MANLGLNVPRATSLRQQVTDSLRESILSGNLRSGQKLIERELCEEMHISRTVLREALQHLEAEGIIVNRPPRGRVVIDISDEEAKGIYDVRRVIESLVIESFSHQANEMQVRRLREKLYRLDALQDPEEIMTAESEIVLNMIEGSDNKVAADILSQLNNRITILRRLSLVDGSIAGSRRAELRALLSSLEQRNPRGKMRAAR